MSAQPARRGWPRRARYLVAGVVVLALAGAAIAAVLYRANMNGAGKVNASPNLRWASVETFDASGADVCTVTLNGPPGNPTTTAQVTYEGESPSSCVVALRVYRIGAHPMQLQDVEWSSFTDETFQPASQCGAAISNNPAAPTEVIVRLAIPAGHDEQTFTVDPNAGLFAVKNAEWAAPACPSPPV